MQRTADNVTIITCDTYEAAAPHGAHWDPTRQCWVEDAIDDAALRALRDEAINHGDPEMAKIAEDALAGDDWARDECVEAILDARAAARGPEWAREYIRQS